MEKQVNRFAKHIICLILISIPYATFALQIDSLSVDSAVVDTAMLLQPEQMMENLPEVEYSTSRKTYEIADIKVTGADNYEDFVIIGFSGLAVGDKIDVPGDQITKSLKRFWKQGLFSDVKIKATKMEAGKVWLEIALTPRPRVSEVVYNGLKKSASVNAE